MKFAVVLAALVAVALAAPLDDPKNAQILRLESDNIGTDGYNFAYETSDGTARQEKAVLKNVGSENEAISVAGEVSWVDNAGQKFTLKYVADENGFRPEGAHLPVA